MPNQIYYGTIKAIAVSLSTATFFDNLIDNYASVYERKPAQSQIDAWKNSIPPLVIPLINSGLGDYHIILEYRLPFDGEHCDVILLGSDSTKINLIIVEQKQWQYINLVNDNNEMVDVPMMGLHAHPSYQVSNYAGKLKNFHSLSDQIEVSACCHLHNMLQDDNSFQNLTSSVFNSILQIAPVFPGEDTSLIDFIKTRIGISPCEISQVESFVNGTYVQSKQFFDGLLSHATDISNRVTSRIVGSGWGLSENQLIIKNQILTSLQSNEKRIFLIHGEPGSGKTLLAVQLLLEILKTKKQALLGLVNNRLMSALRSCLDRSLPGASGSLKYFTPRFGYGLSKLPDGLNMDIVICDEGQRMSMKEMVPILSSAPIVIVFYDESQRLLPVEQGTKHNFSSTATNLNIPVSHHRLSSNHRCKGGNAYQSWIDSLLTNPSNLEPKSETIWKDRYSFLVPDSLADMISELQHFRNHSQSDVCLLASFTETDGKSSKIRTVNPQIAWAMEGNEYVDFWINRKSNDLNKCASIFGCQGFERSYAGIIWGHDYVIRNGKWTISLNHTITDYIGRPSLLNLVNRGQIDQALDLLYNRYRIMLTRGIDGTLVYCEDSETKEFLQSIQG